MSLQSPTLVFKVEGGRHFGMGRVTRSLTLAQEILRLQPATIGFFVNDDAVSVATIQAAGFPAEIVPQNPEEFARHVAQRAGVVVIFDQESEIQPFSDALRQSNVRLVALDCFEMDNDGLHVIVNLFNHASRKRPASDKVLYLDGLAYAIIRAEFDCYLNQEKTVAGRAQRVLVSFGGADPRGNTLRVLRAMRHDNTRDLHLDVTLGSNFANPDELEAAAAELSMRVSFHRSPGNFAELMHRSDVAFTGGGTTLLEAAAVGTPVLAIAQTKAEVRFCKVLADGGAALTLGLGGEQDAESIHRHLVALLNDHRRRGAMSAAGRRHVDGQGRKRLAEIALEQAAWSQSRTGSTA